MDLPNIFSPTVTSEIIDRINKLEPTTQAQWGKMSVSQMLAHCNVTYELVYEDKHPRPGILMGLILRTFIKKFVTSDKPYKQNLRTAPAFLITDKRNFEAEKKRLIDHINKTQQFGETHFDGKRSHSFGKLTANEWNNMFYKHLDHHLRQFGV